MSKSDDETESEWREWTDLDTFYGEWIARDLEKRVREEGEHFERAHSRDPFDGIMNSLFGTAEKEECINPRCSAERFIEEESQSESWWERWFRGAGNGDDGESGSSD